jgi:flavin reductase (DIM6/NTAB) family NADH-FMN oxidoreductase RutF
MAKKNLRPNTLLVPAPVVMVSCQRAGEKPNIITIAWVGVVCSAPPMLGISIRPSRYSHDIIKDSGEFVVNIPTRELCEATDYCGIVSGREVDKFEGARLTPEASTTLKAPSIKECPVSIECQLKEVKPLGAHDLFLGEVVAVAADESVLSDGRIQISQISPIAYMPPSHEYWSLGESVGRFGYSGKKSGKIEE